MPIILAALTVLFLASRLVDAGLFRRDAPVVFYPNFASTAIFSEETTLALAPPKASSTTKVSASATSTTPTASASCVVIPHGWGVDDSSQILAAVEACGNYGTITLPAPYVYTIDKRMHMKLNHAKLEVHGTLSFTPDLQYWIDNSFRVEFQNQSTAWIVEGSDYTIDGGGWQQGGILGNGQAWMTRAAGHSNQFGRPISISLFNSTNATLSNFSFRQPQFWSIYVQDSSNVALTGIYINGTNTDPAGNGSNYETNIDGLDTIRVDKLLVKDWLFHGGDDCLAPKGNSTNMVFQNLTCVGGGIAFGSIGQYPDAPDYIFNVSASNISVSQSISPTTGGAAVGGGAYFKSWVGVTEGVPPQGGGGGTGKVSNITFNGLHVQNISQAVYINKCYYKVADQANYCDTSTLEFGQLGFYDVSGTVSGSTALQLNCSAAAPCHDVAFGGVNLTSSVTGGNGTQKVKVACDNVVNVMGVVCNATLS